MTENNFPEKKDKIKEKSAKKDQILVSELEKIKKNSEEYLEGWKRAQADYINLKRRVESDISELTSFANAELVTKIIPIMENFRRAFTHIPENLKEDEWVKGVKNVEKQLEDTLRNEGLQKIDTEGKEFDPNLCEALMFEESKNHKDNEIIEELEAGYIFKDKVIKPAKVKVCKK